MSHITDIGTGIKTALVAHPFFIASPVYTREFAGNPTDDINWTEPVLFVYPDTTDQQEQPFVTDFRWYRFNVELRFRYEGRALVDTASDTVMGLKSDYLDAILEAVRECRPSGQYPITEVLHVDFAGSELYQDEISDVEKDYAILVRFNVSTYESNTRYVLTDDSGTYALTDDDGTYILTE